ncbi:MAG: hypothetical protein ACXWAC_01710 [Usitatibacter sp.]
MKSLALALSVLTLSLGAPSFAQSHGSSHGGPAMHSFGGPRVVASPGWRHFAPGRHFVQHRPFRFRGHTFIFIGAPLFAAPWLYYPYVWDAQWGPRYYDPAQPGYFLYYCPQPAGYYPEVALCPTGWYPVVPSESDEDY